MWAIADTLNTADYRGAIVLIFLRFVTAQRDIPSPSAGRKYRHEKYLAETVGTFVLVFGGVGSAVLAGTHIGYLGVAFAFGLSLLAMVYTIGPVSGCHINPAVTVGVLIAKKIGAKDAMSYIIAQIIGAIIASAVILVIAKGTVAGYDPAVAGLGANGFGEHSPGGYSMMAAFIAEVVVTMFLVLTVLGSTDVKAPVGFGSRDWLSADADSPRRNPITNTQ